IANDLWTWYPCGVACGAGEMVEETSDLTGSSWTTSGQYLRAGGGCSSLLIRRKSSTDEEYHHADLRGMHITFTNMNSEMIGSFIFDHFGYGQFAGGDVISTHTFFTQLNDNLVDAGSVMVPARYIKLHLFDTKVRPMDLSICSDNQNWCIALCGGEGALCVGAVAAFLALGAFACLAATIFAPACWIALWAAAFIGFAACALMFEYCLLLCKLSYNRCAGIPVARQAISS
ncbi:hypothetical protein, partial [Ferroplasma sp.]|uniref:hypothetical protein n=1 Tax=Ferroplasma sp. TaxID=2591003 RepID=UPI00261EA92B